MAKKRTADHALEQMVVGGCLRYRDQFDVCLKIIRKPDIFRSYAHRVAWAALQTMAQDALPFDPATLFEVLLKRNQGDDCKAAYIVDLWDASPASNVDHHARTLLDLYVRRELTEEMQRCTEDFGDPASSPLVTVEAVKAKIETIAGLLYDDAPKSDGDAQKWVPFPIDTLPSIMQDYCLHAAEALHTDPAYIALPMLVTAAAVIGNSRVMHIKETWIEPCVLWGAVVADSSTMKSPAMEKAVSPIVSIQHEQSSLYEFERQRWKDDMEQWKQSAFDHARNKSSADTPNKPNEPTPKKIVVSDITIEKLAHVMWQNPQGVVMFRDELSGWFGSFGRYADGAGASTDMSAWLSIFGARSWTVDRKGGDPPSIYVPRAACSVFGTIQPKILRRILTDDYFDSGLASRLLLCMPPKKPKVWTEAIIPQVHFDAYHEAIRSLYDSGSLWMRQNNNAPKPIWFTSAGKAAWIEFYSEWSDRQNHAEGEISYALAKLEAVCARLCMIFAAFEKASVSSRREEVTEGQVRRVFTLVKWFAAEIERVYRMLKAPEEANQTKKLVEFIVGHEGVMTASRLQKANPSKWETADDAEAALDKLVQKGLGKWEMVPSGPKGGRPSKRFLAKTS